MVSRWKTSYKQKLSISIMAEVSAMQEIQF